MLSHRNLVVNVDQVLAAADFRPGEVAAGFLPFFHIYGMNVIMNVHLAGGGGIVTLPRFDLPLFLQICQDHKSRRMWIVPPVALASGASGLPLPNTECRIVDIETGEDLPAGGEGELWIRGPQVMKGYLNNPEATANTITEDGWLKTGDIAIIDEDGYMFIVDRLKELIKYKGFQVAPAELEATLVSHEAITDAAVVGLPDDEAGELPVAFVVAGDPAPTVEAIQAFLGDTLAHYKQVHAVHFVDAIPKSASGKILRRLLRSQLQSDTATG